MSSRADAVSPQTPRQPEIAGTDRVGLSSASQPMDPPAGLEGRVRDRQSQLDAELAEIDALLAAAHFHTVLALAGKSRGLLDTFAPDARLDSRRAQLEVMTATAEIALGRRAQARRSLQRALRADAALALDQQATSPKLLSLLHELRGSPGPGEQRP